MHVLCTSLFNIDVKAGGTRDKVSSDLMPILSTCCLTWPMWSSVTPGVGVQAYPLCSHLLFVANGSEEPMLTAGTNIKLIGAA
jgi:hypothetical protein